MHISNRLRAFSKSSVDAEDVNDSPASWSQKNPSHSEEPSRVPSHGFPAVNLSAPKTTEVNTFPTGQRNPALPGLDLPIFCMLSTSCFGNSETVHPAEGPSNLWRGWSHVTHVWNQGALCGLRWPAKSGQWLKSCAFCIHRTYHVDFCVPAICRSIVCKIL